MRHHLIATTCLLLTGTCALGAPSGADGDDVDRIVAAVGVDAMHSVDEEARMRAMTEQVFDSAPVLAPLRTGPDFERVFRHLIMDQQRIRRDPAVFRAYRVTLERLLTPAELHLAAEFYSTSAGVKAHMAAIEAQKAAVAAMNEVPGRHMDDPAVGQAFSDTLGRMLSAQDRQAGAVFYNSRESQNIHAAVLDAEDAAAAAMDEVTALVDKGPPPGFTHDFAHGIDVFFAQGSSKVDTVQRERIVSVLKKAREAEPDKAWCASLVGFSETGEADTALAGQRRDAVKAVLNEFGFADSSLSVKTLSAKSAYLKPGTPGAAITEIEQFPCKPG